MADRGRIGEGGVMSKYHAHANQYKGYRFDSIAEREHFKKLLALQQAGKITGLQVHPRFELQPAFKDNTGAKQRAIVYEADFSYTEAGKQIIEDVKGVETPVFKLKAKIFKRVFPHLELRVVK